MKKKVKLKRGGEIEVYEHEKYRLWKKGLLDLPKKENEKYQDKLDNEPLTKIKKKIEGSQTDRLNKRLDKLEKKGVEFDPTELNDKISKLEDDLLSVLERLDKLEKAPVGPTEKK